MAVESQYKVSCAEICCMYAEQNFGPGGPHDNASKDDDEEDIPERVEITPPENPPPDAQIPSGSGGNADYGEEGPWWER